MSGTDIGYAGNKNPVTDPTHVTSAVVPRARYAESGTELGYAATRTVELDGCGRWAEEGEEEAEQGPVAPYLSSYALPTYPPSSTLSRASACWQYCSARGRVSLAARYLGSPTSLCRCYQMPGTDPAISYGCLAVPTLAISYGYSVLT
eukprot:1092393-Rhodomonas_salina.7